VAKSDTGMMGGRMAHEFMALTGIGEDTLVLCDACGYSANRQVASFRKPEPPTAAPLPLEEVATPNVTTIAALAEVPGHSREPDRQGRLHGRRPSKARRQPKEQFVFCVVRGDMELNETKLTNAIKARRLRPATTTERSRRSAPNPATARPSASTREPGAAAGG
jgi:prolyl-tRNA synthetase